MQREMRFRAWHKTHSPQKDEDNPKVINGMLGVKGIFTSNKGHQYVDLFGFASSVLVDNVELMQFTGLKDKNGAPIFDGDILKHDLWGTATVEWDNLRGGWACKKNGETTDDIFDVGLGHMQLKRTKVIGNIHESPELLTSPAKGE